MSSRKLILSDTEAAWPALHLSRSLGPIDLLQDMIPFWQDEGILQGGPVAVARLSRVSRVPSESPNFARQQTFRFVNEPELRPDMFFLDDVKFDESGTAVTERRFFFPLTQCYFLAIVRKPDAEIGFSGPCLSSSCLQQCQSLQSLQTLQTVQRLCTVTD